jgi:hypothetical protein
VAVSPVFHDDALSVYRPFEDGDLASILSGDAGNALAEGLDHKLYVPALSVSPGDLISGDAGNLIELGDDGKLFSLGCDINPADLISLQDGDNIIELGDDGLLYADRNAPCSVVIAAAVSQDAGNVLTFGQDGLLFVPPNPCVIEISDLVSSDGDNVLIYGQDGLLKVVAPEECSVDISGIISSDPDNKITIGADGLLTISYSDEMDATLHFVLDQEHDPDITISFPERDLWTQWKYELRTSNGTPDVGLSLVEVSDDGSRGAANYGITTAWAAVPAWFATAQSIAFMAVPLAGNPATVVDMLVSLRKG